MLRKKIAGDICSLENQPVNTISITRKKVLYEKISCMSSRRICTSLKICKALCILCKKISDVPILHVLTHSKVYLVMRTQITNSNRKAKNVCLSDTVPTFASVLNLQLSQILTPPFKTEEDIP